MRSNCWHTSAFPLVISEGLETHARLKTRSTELWTRIMEGAYGGKFYLQHHLGCSPHKEHQWPSVTLQCLRHTYYTSTMRSRSPTVWSRAHNLSSQKLTKSVWAGEIFIKKTERIIPKHKKRGSDSQYVVNKCSTMIFFLKDFEKHNKTSQFANYIEILD